ncbi:MAG: serpin family protein [Erysipelotrichaceae bacterium]|nr:serpin family protein [Erysipelotrichaceae bacterium]
MKPKQTKHIAILCIAVGALLMSCSNPSSKTLLLGKKNVTNGLAVSSMNEKEQAVLKAFSAKTIAAFREDKSQSFGFSPLSYEMALGLSHALAVEGAKPERFAVADAKELGTLIHDTMATLPYIPKDYKSGETSLVRLGNLVFDGSSAFSEDARKEITDKYGTSYAYSAENFPKDVADWKTDLSEGKMVTSKEATPKDGAITLLNGVYFDLLYETAFDPAFDYKAAFNEEGSHTFFKNKSNLTFYHEGEDYIAFSQPTRDSGYRIRYLMPKAGTFSSFLEKNDFASCFEGKAENAYTTFSLPEISLSSNWDLKDLAKEQGLDTPLRFQSGGPLYDMILELKQSNVFSFSHHGIQGYSLTKMVMIPEAAPTKEVSLNHSFAFDVVSPDNIPIFYGEVVSL